MKQYLLFLIQTISNIFNPAISVLSRVEYSNVSKKAKIWRFAKLDHSEIGDYTYVGPKARIIHAKIGKYCSIANETAVGMGTHPIKFLSTSPLFIATQNGTGHSWLTDKKFDEYRQVTLGHDVWVGAKVLIMGGVKIGTGAVIAAGAVVTKDVPPYAIVGGVPAKIIKYRFDEETIQCIMKSKWWDLPDNILKERLSCFQSINISTALSDLSDSYSTET